MDKIKKIDRISKWRFISEGTGYSPDYCKMVVNGSRSQTSKGGKIIMKKYNELQKFLTQN